MPIVKFTLWYDGQLKSNGSPADKHMLRNWFHGQLKEVWDSGTLRLLSQFRDPSNADSHVIEAYGSSYLVMLRPDVGTADLDITLLTPTEPQRPVLVGPDIDNRLKTLFDALRIPSQQQEVPTTFLARPATDPLCVMLADDRLISRVTVHADRYLNAPTKDDVRLLVTARLHADHTPRTYHNVAFL
jgi:hypothetical protein